MTSSTARPHVVFDSIIFGLQKFGGISNYWNRMISYAVASGAFDTTLLLPKDVISSAFDQRHVPAGSSVREGLPAMVSRYCRGGYGSSPIFHTSYYRLPRHSAGKYVVTVYDFIYERYRTGLAKWVHHRQKMESIRRADVVVCISESTRQDVLKYCPEVDPAVVHAIPLAVDREVYFAESQSRLQEPKDVLFVGQRGGYKRFDLAVEALERLPDLNLGIVGTALTCNEYEILRKRLGGRWIYHGAVATDCLRSLYANAVCLVFPSDYEGFGLPTLEAMACGCAVVSSRAASLREVGGSAALYADSQTADSYAHAIGLLRHGALRDKLVKLGLVRAAGFSWQDTCLKTFALYGEAYVASPSQIPPRVAGA